MSPRAAGKDGKARETGEAWQRQSGTGAGRRPLRRHGAYTSARTRSTSRTTDASATEATSS